MRKEDIPLDVLEEALSRGPSMFVAGSEDAMTFWTDEEYEAHFGSPKPQTDEDYAALCWKDLKLYLEEDYSPGRSQLVTLPGVLENRDHIAAWAAQHPELRQVQGDDRYLAFLYDYMPDKWLLEPTDSRLIYRRSTP